MKPAENPTSPKYLVTVDDKPLQVAESLEAAKTIGAMHVHEGKQIVIELRNAPAPTVFWRFDREVGWVTDRQ